MGLSVYDARVAVDDATGRVMGFYRADGQVDPGDIPSHTRATVPPAKVFGRGLAYVEGILVRSDGIATLPYPAGWTPVASKAFAGTPLFLPYGTTDASVVFQHPLTTIPTAAELGYGTRAYIGDAEGPTADYRGLKCKSPTANVFSGIHYSSPNQKIQKAYEALRYGGQFSVDVEAAFVGAGSADLNSYAGGYTPGTAEVQIMIGAASSTKPIYLGYKAANGSTAIYAGTAQNTLSSTAGTWSKPYSAGTMNDLLWVAGGIQTGSSGYYHHGLDDYVRITAAWDGNIGGRATFAVDSYVCGACILSEDIVNLAQKLVIGAASEFSSSPVGHSYKFKNLLLSTKKPDFTAHAITQKVGVLSDSILSGSSPQLYSGISATAYRQRVWHAKFQAVLAQNGILMDELFMSGNGGYSGSTVGAGTSHFSDTSLGVAPRTRVRNRAPTTFIYCATNDVGNGATTQQYIDAVTDHLDYMFAVGAYAGQVGAPIQLAIICGVPDRRATNNWDATERTTAQAVNTALEAFVGVGGTYDLLRPGLGKLLRFGNIWRHTGGATNYTYGLSSVDNIHPDWLGNEGIGIGLASVVVDYVKSL